MGIMYCGWSSYTYYNHKPLCVELDIISVTFDTMYIDILWTFFWCGMSFYINVRLIRTQISSGDIFTHSTDRRLIWDMGQLQRAIWHYYWLVLIVCKKHSVSIVDTALHTIYSMTGWLNRIHHLCTAVSVCSLFFPIIASVVYRSISAYFKNTTLYKNGRV